MKLPLLKNLIKPIIVAIIIGALFGTYMLLIGIPKTRAAGYYKLATDQEGLGAYERADEYYKKAIENFAEPYIVQSYQEFQLARNK